MCPIRNHSSAIKAKSALVAPKDDKTMSELTSLQILKLISTHSTVVGVIEMVLS